MRYYTCECGDEALRVKIYPYDPQWDGWEVHVDFVTTPFHPSVWQRLCLAWRLLWGGRHEPQGVILSAKKARSLAQYLMTARGREDGAA